MSYLEIAATALDEWEQTRDTDTEDFDLGASISKAKRNSVGMFKDMVSGAAKSKIGNEGIAGAMQDLAKHDAQRHGGHFDPTKGTCKFREEMSKTLNSMGMLNGQNPEMEAQIKAQLGEGATTAGAQQANEAQKNGDVDAELAEIQNLVKERKWEKDSEKKAKLQADIDAKRDAYYRRNMRDAEYDAMKQLEAKAAESPAMAEKVVEAANKIVEDPESDDVSKDAAKAVIEKALPNTPMELTKAQRERQKREEMVQAAIQHVGTAEATAKRAMEALSKGVTAAEEAYKNDGNETNRQNAIEKAKKKHFELMKQAYMQKSPDKYTQAVEKLGQVGDGTLKFDGDSGACTLIKKGDKYYGVDSNGNAFGSAMNAEEAVVYAAERYDKIGDGTTAEEHWKVCRASPKSNCPFLRQHRQEMSAEARENVFGDNPLMERSGRLRATVKPDLHLGEEQALALAETIAEHFGEENLEKVWPKAIEKVSDNRQLDDPTERDRIVGEVANELNSQGVDPSALSGSGEGSTSGGGAGEGSTEGSAEASTNNNSQESRANPTSEQAQTTNRAKGVRGSEPTAENGKQLNEYEDNGKTYVDVSGLGWFKGIKESIKAGIAGKGIITDWDKVHSRWRDIQDRIPSNQKSNLSGLQEGLQDSFEDMLFTEALKNDSLTLGQKAYVQSLYNAWGKAKPEQKPRYIKSMNDFMSSVGLEKSDKEGYGTGGFEKITTDAKGPLPTTSILKPKPPFVADQTKQKQTVQDIETELRRKGINVKADESTLLDGPSQYSIELEYDPNTTSTSLISNAFKAQANSLGIKDPKFEHLVEGKRNRVRITIKKADMDRRPASFRALMEHKDTAKQIEKMAIPMQIGETMDGSPVWGDFIDHGLLGGTTGSGKTTSLNSGIGSLFMARSPKQVRVLINDAAKKGQDLGKWNGDKHLIGDVATTEEDVVSNLKTMCDEIDRRAKILGGKSIAQYNAEMRAQGKDELPYILGITDEMTDLFDNAQYGDEAARLIAKIVRKGRSLGVSHLGATQRPSAKNTPKDTLGNNRICLKMKTPEESNMVINGYRDGDKLRKHGDGVTDVNGELTSIQAPLIDDDDIKAIRDYDWSGNGSTPSSPSSPTNPMPPTQPSPTQTPIPPSPHTNQENPTSHTETDVSPTATLAKPPKVLSAKEQNTVSQLEKMLNRPGITESQKKSIQAMIDRIKGIAGIKNTSGSPSSKKVSPYATLSQKQWFEQLASDRRQANGETTIQAMR